MVNRFRTWSDRRVPGAGKVLGGLIVPLAGLLLLGLLAGLAAARYGLVVPLGTLVGLGIALVAPWQPWIGLLLATGIAVLLPFAALPIDLIVTPTYLELALLGALAGWLVPPLLRRDRHWRLSALDGLVWVFVGVSLFALVVGWGRGVDASTLHNYAKTALGIGAFWGVRQVVGRREQVRRFLATFLLTAALAALIALLLHALPDRTALNLLVRMEPLGYPATGRVLRYVEDDPSGLERAIGTSVDPNSFGGMLALAAAVALGEVLIGFPLVEGPLPWAERWRGSGPAGPLRTGARPARRRRAPRSLPPSGRPALPHVLLLVILLLLLGALYLTYSRAALGGFAVAALFLAGVRYRRLWWPIAATVVLLAVLIVGLGRGGAVVERFRQGIRFEDPANQMRLDEYANAAAIIRRYPLLGVGLGGAPDVDLSTGVSSLYLTIAEHMGLLGLVAFLAAVGAALGRAYQRYRQTDALSPHRLALLAGVIAALAIGLLDHYFYNLEFPHMATLLWMVLGVATVTARD